MSQAGPAARGLIVHSVDPLNCEPPLGRLRESFMTPSALFYVRSHGDVPSLDAAAHRLRVTGRVARPLDLSLRELRERFPRRTVVAALQCAGNRRADLARVRPVSGDPWAGGAIGNAAWGGVGLADVLRAAGAEDGAALHVAFAACDECEAGGERFRYAVSIPMPKALAPEVLLADEMNGAPLAPEHGFPLRAVVPGFAGVRSAKWVAAVEVRESPADTPIQRHDYHLLPAAPEEWQAGTAIDEMPVNAAICSPAPGTRLPPGRVEVRGWALASGRPVARVEVSGDDGRHWTQAALQQAAGAPWSWTFWDAALDLPRGEHTLVVRAWDAAGQTQPAMPEEVWNPNGYLAASWHRVPIRLH